MAPVPGWEEDASQSSVDALCCHNKIALHHTAAGLAAFCDLSSQSYCVCGGCRCSPLLLCQPFAVPVCRQALTCTDLHSALPVDFQIWRRDRLPTPVFLGFPCGSAGKESAYNVGDLGSIPGLGRSPGERKGFPL